MYMMCVHCEEMDSTYQTERQADSQKQAERLTDNTDQRGQWSPSPGAEKK